MPRYTLPLFALLALCVPTAPAHAAMFCVEVEGLPSQCIYDDPAQCRARATELAGICDLNPAQAQVRPGFGPFCLIYAGRTSQCVYSDRDGCEAEAARNRSSICVQNNLAGKQPNPYSYDPGKAY
jgi:hypothetical protein